MTLAQLQNCQSEIKKIKKQPQEDGLKKVPPIVNLWATAQAKLWALKSQDATWLKRRHLEIPAKGQASTFTKELACRKHQNLVRSITNHALKTRSKIKSKCLALGPKRVTFQILRWFMHRLKAHSISMSVAPSSFNNATMQALKMLRLISKWTIKVWLPYPFLALPPSSPLAIHPETRCHLR